MTSEQVIYEDFANGSLKFFDAVHLLEGIGYHFDDAEDLVSEWADGLEPIDPMRGVEFPFADNH